jgi:predicted MFS family arabinose efflux permease
MLANAAAELVVPSHAQVVTVKGAAANQFAFLRSVPVWLCFAFFFFVTAAFGILQNYSPAILGNVYGMSLVVATGSLTAYLLGSAAGTITGGFLASRNDRNDRLIAIALGFSALMALLLASGQIGAALVIPTMVLLGFGVGTSGPNRDLLVRRAATSQFGKTSFGRIYGFVYSGLDVGLAMSPLVFGPLLDAGKFQAALVAVAMLQVAALLTAMRIGTAARSRAVAA